uniref:DNA helicase n=1 Tax=Macrostomum lignano TaxID=282301 RepID=A0A1I8FR26_9PLAT
LRRSLHRLCQLAVAPAPASGLRCRGLAGATTTYLDVSVPQDDPTVARLYQAVLNQQRTGLAQAITLVESRHPEKQARGQALVNRLLKHLAQRQHKRCFRVGITGTPGAGKSTFIECIGQDLVKRQGKRIAVLTAATGPLLGDATRMPELCVHPARLFAQLPARQSRPAWPATPRMRCAVRGGGFDCLLIETMGVGQAEYQTCSCCCNRLAVATSCQGVKARRHGGGGPGGGDQVRRQPHPAANHAATELSRALRTYQRMKHPLSGWRPRVLRCSALTGEGVPERVTDSGELVQHRVAQLEKWMWLHSPAVAATLPALLDELRQGLKSPGNAADLLLRCFLENRAR